VTDAIARRELPCPRCGEELAPEIAGAFALHRCSACGGAWLDPETFRTACEPYAKASGPNEGHGAERVRPAVTRDEPVRYLPCPVCRDMMSRVNFARVSGVILDVCRPHGAWLEAGELRAIRRFLRGSGLERAARRRALDAERARRRPERGAPDAAPVPDLLDVITGGRGPWDVPPAGPAWRSLLWAVVLGAAGAALLWSAFDASSPRGALGGAILGCLLLLAAVRVFVRRL